MTRSTTDGELVKVAYANDEAEAELIQGLLRLSDVESVVRRAPGFDVPEFLAAGPREVLVAASDVPVARDVLREVEPVQPDEPEPSSRSGTGRPSPVVVGLLLALTLVVVVVCVAADVFP
jgi:hypothetical protein